MNRVECVSEGVVTILLDDDHIIHHWLLCHNDSSSCTVKLGSPLCNSCNIGMRDLPDVYAQNQRAARSEG